MTLGLPNPGACPNSRKRPASMNAGGGRPLQGRNPPSIPGPRWFSDKSRTWTFDSGK
jgi:hypothetical protein